MPSEEYSGEDLRRFTYEQVTYGKFTGFNADYETLEDAIDDMAADGWRFVESAEQHAVFERTV